MGHKVSGVIAKTATAERFGRDYGLARPATLSSGLSFLALDNENLAQVVGPGTGAAVDGFEYLTPELMAALSQSSRSGDLVYIETEYFGGTGAQGAAVFQAGMITFGPKIAEIGVINEALATLGILSEDPAVDAFERIGLNRYRSNEKFRASARDLSGGSSQRSAGRRTPKHIWWLLAIIVVAAAIWVAAVVAINVGIDFQLPNLH